MARCELGDGTVWDEAKLYWVCPRCVTIHRRNTDKLTAYNAEYQAVLAAEMKRGRTWRCLPCAFLTVLLTIILAVILT